MKVHRHAIEAYARTALSSTTPARPAEPLATQLGGSGNEAAAVAVSEEARAAAVKRGARRDEQKIAALRKRISAGEYHVNPQILAMRILDSFG